MNPLLLRHIVKDPADLTLTEIIMDIGGLHGDRAIALLVKVRQNFTLHEVIQRFDGVERIMANFLLIDLRISEIRGGIKPMMKRREPYQLHIVRDQPQ